MDARYTRSRTRMNLPQRFFNGDDRDAPRRSCFRGSRDSNTRICVYNASVKQARSIHEFFFT